jgi:glycosyltransferase involved in cell wall biosynthesis
MTIDLVICTYNRPQQVVELVQQVLDCDPLPNAILIIDSSDEENQEIQHMPRVRYLRSNHKNQPYQRYLGYSISSADILLYLDDDMEIIHKNILHTVAQRFAQDQEIVGLALHFQNKQQEHSLSRVPTSTLFHKRSGLKKMMGWLTGYPQLLPGSYGRCGNRGPHPTESGYTMLISGGAFAAKRSALYINFNFQLFDLFETKMGMGEDGILGYTLLQQGKLFYESNLQCWHNDNQPSNYAHQLRSYAKRVLFSRLYLSLEKARLDGTSLRFARTHYAWYGWWRLVGYAVNYLRHRKEARKEIFMGSLEGYKEAIHSPFYPVADRKAYWDTETQKVL